uniref:Homeobox domain-containing protein n=1 Tax=Caenorhabditis tropicalis TaxID=1561998 RepID=A0A1I7U5E6_9PELO
MSDFYSCYIAKMSSFLSPNPPKINYASLPAILSTPVPRTTKTAFQIEVMSQRFIECPFIKGKEMKNLSKNIGLSSAKIRFWFKNQRVNLKKVVASWEFDYSGYWMIEGYQPGFGLCWGGSVGQTVDSKEGILGCRVK